MDWVRIFYLLTFIAANFSAAMSLFLLGWHTQTDSFNFQL